MNIKKLAGITVGIIILMMLFMFVSCSSTDNTYNQSLGRSKKNQKAFFDDYDFGGLFASYLDTDLETWSFTPRVITPHRLF